MEVAYLVSHLLNRNVPVIHHIRSDSDLCHLHTFFQIFPFKSLPFVNVFIGIFFYVVFNHNTTGRIKAYQRSNFSTLPVTVVNVSHDVSLNSNLSGSSYIVEL